MNFQPKGKRAGGESDDELLNLSHCRKELGFRMAHSATRFFSFPFFSPGKNQCYPKKHVAVQDIWLLQCFSKKRDCHRLMLTRRLPLFPALLLRTLTSQLGYIIKLRNGKGEREQRFELLNIRNIIRGPVTSTEHCGNGKEQKSVSTGYTNPTDRAYPGYILFSSKYLHIMYSRTEIKKSK